MYVAEILNEWQINKIILIKRKQKWTYLLTKDSSLWPSNVILTPLSHPK